MKFDRFDRLIIVFLLLTIVGLSLLLSRTIPERTTKIETRNMERELAAQARQALLDKLYSPVAASMQAGQMQEALLKLEEINVRYPGEAHGFILKGEIFDRLGVPDKAAASLVQGVKLNGDYIDKRSSVSRRDLITRLVDSTLPGAVSAYRNSPVNAVLKENLANLNYLKSRLAGGCE
ncbi:MAG: hypothetical protein HXX17_00245 [Geobacteraceae bacterium]|nr:hypothetical protein [Geobacteraceae bacterium]